MSLPHGLIGDISRYCAHDGPGIRTTVFFKGCTLRCPWCHNPEFLSTTAEIAFSRKRCIACGECIAVCPDKAISLTAAVQIDRSRCTICGKCVVVCPGNALELVGKTYTVDELTEIILRDRKFYDASGGGVTLSGGEASSQLPFIAPFLKRLKEEGLHTAIETNGLFNGDLFANQCLDFIDLILFDVKIADPARHRFITGVDNKIILENLSELIKLRPGDIIARIPLVAGYTATEKNIQELAALFRAMNIQRCSLLPYHPYGSLKGVKVGRTVDNTLPEKQMSDLELEKWQHYFTGIEVVEFP